MTKQHRQLAHFIHIGRVAELEQIEKTDSHIKIGAGVTHQQAMTYLAEDYPALQEIWARFGSAQVRASGRVCANIANASPIGDLSPCFLALGAEILLNRGGDKRQIRLEDFFIDYGQQDRLPGEFVEAILLPRLPDDQHLYAYKISKRFDQDISAVLMAACIEIDQDKIADIKIGFGGMAAIPKRAINLEGCLKGQAVSELAKLGQLSTTALANAVTQALAADFDPIDDMRASRTYRLVVAAQLVEKLFKEHLSGYCRLSSPRAFRVPDDFTMAAKS